MPVKRDIPISINGIKVTHKVVLFIYRVRGRYFLIGGGCRNCIVVGIVTFQVGRRYDTREGIFRRICDGSRKEAACSRGRRPVTFF